MTSRALESAVVRSTCQDLRPGMTAAASCAPRILQLSQLSLAKRNAKGRMLV